ncbi:beta-L-arabinofuranosidase domain-containing protein [Rhodopirellula sallentina]|uniref:Sulfatase domain protein n=1 Tax=Rhodopirellula sallentina SM41 TaxID=1263870 RepID=M5UGU4_9BACT|nr:beta-L-arabinofuranosidase domain-containing protein [Rhodopirellula sallentina]EMI57071.1 sulfatase domain protein [Rhodopirellula sallentina SM41]
MLVLLAAAFPAFAAERPNVLLILVDDLKPAIGAYGDTLAKTPNIDRLAASGMRFDMAYCNQAVCAPSRFTLMLGSHSTSTGLYGLGSPLRQLVPNAVTMPQYFAKHGYRTESLGKVFHIGHGNHGDPDSFSVPHFKEKVIEYADPASTPGGKLTREEAMFQNVEAPKGGMNSLPRGAAFESPDVADEAYADGRVAAEAIRRLQAAKERDRPFFIVAGFARPHLPFSAPKKYWDLYNTDALKLAANPDLPIDSPKVAHKRGGEIRNYFPVPDKNDPAAIDETTARKLIHGYYASTSFVDAQIGKILDELESSGQSDNTIVVLWGDHGFHLGDLGIWTKHTNYEQANRIPILISAPGVTKPGSSTKQLTESVDIFPTLAELAGLDTPIGPQPIDGLSLVPVLKDPSARVRDHAYHAYPNQKLGRAIRTERYRMVEWRAFGAAEDTAEYELYDYQKDPLERLNLAATRPEVVSRLKEMLAKYPNPVPRGKRRKPAKKTVEKQLTIQKSNNAPNFVFILTDDQGWTGLSVPMDKSRTNSQSDYYQTPNIARLAKSGMRFSRGYSPAPNCSPSRYANLTGKTCARLSFTDIVGRGHVIDLKGKQKLRPGGKGTREILAADITIPELLKTLPVGYRTAHLGKWHLKGGGPEAHGFDVSDGATGNKEGSKGPAVKSDPKLAFSITSRANAFMEASVADGKPFYCQVSHYAVHQKIQHRAETLKKTQGWKSGKAHSDPAYAAMVADLDEAVGQLLNKIEDLGIGDNTYIIYQADNGSPKFLSESPPLRRYKPEIWDGGVRVPTFLSGPGIAADSQCDHPVMGIDILPTIWELAGGDAEQLPEDIDGGSIVRTVKAISEKAVASPNIERTGELVVHSPHYVLTKDLAKNQRPSSAIFDGKWKLVAWYETGEVQLFDLDADISESTDVSKQHPEVKHDLWTRLRDYLANTNARLPTLDPLHESNPGKDGDADNDGLPDEWEFRQLLTHVLGPEDDSDQDDKSNLAEFKAKSDPLVAKQQLQTGSAASAQKSKSFSQLSARSSAEIPYPIQLVHEVELAPKDFWHRRVETNHQVTVWHNFQQCEITGRLNNFRKAAGEKPGFYEGLRFNDSDVHKIVEGAARILAVNDDPKLDEYLDKLIATMAKAQEDNGYLYTVMQVPHNPNQRPVKGVVFGERWLHEQESHETYAMGHLIEAGAVHYEATGKRNLLDIAIKAADCLDKAFGPGKLELPPGHQQIEIGLAKLAAVTGEERYTRLAKFFLEQRGRRSDDRRQTWGVYFQDHLPVTQQAEAVGHSVRAAYQYMAMADLAVLTDDDDYRDALHDLWENVAKRKLYLTGGIGGGSGEGFSGEYQLPNFRAYNETCSSIANILWHRRMFQLEGDAKYIDILERCLYNSFLSGVGMDGDTFFYPNKLTSVTGHRRSAWFNCACCPPNVTRFLPQIPSLMYAKSDDTLFVNLFGSNNAYFALANQTVKVEQYSNYPWDGNIQLTVRPAEQSAFKLALRIPGWLKVPFPSDLYRYANDTKTAPQIQVNGDPVEFSENNGYAVITRIWQPGDKIELSLPMTVRRVLAHPNVAATRDRVALMRGPIVYAAEGPDNDGKVHSLTVPDEAAFTAEFRDNLLGGVNTLIGTVKTVARSGSELKQSDHQLTAIPYYAWAHRGAAPMRVWLAAEPKSAWPCQSEMAYSRANVTSSGKNPWTSASSANDQIFAPVSGDNETPRFLWDKTSTAPIGAEELAGTAKADSQTGGVRWIQYDFDEPVEISSTAVYWVTGGNGNWALPQQCRLLCKRDGEWQQVDAELPQPKADMLQKAEFTRLTTTSVRLEVVPQIGKTAGIMEWVVD